MKKATKDNQPQPCQTCGTCPTCGRGSAFVHYWPTWTYMIPAYPTLPYWQQPWYVGKAGMTTGGSVGSYGGTYSVSAAGASLTQLAEGDHIG